MVQAYAARDRVATAHLSDEPTTPEDVKSILLESLLPAVCGRRWGIQRGIQKKKTKTLNKHVSIFHSMQADRPKHQYEENSAKRSKMVLTPVGQICLV